MTSKYISKDIQSNFFFYVLPYAYAYVGAVKHLKKKKKNTKDFFLMYIYITLVHV